MLKKYKINFGIKEYQKLTLKEIVEINAKRLASFYIQGRKLDTYTLNSFPETIKSKIYWNRISIEELNEIGFRKWNENIYILPVHIWNLIPIGTKLYSVKTQKYFIKTGNEELVDTILGYLPYGFKKKRKKLNV